MEMLIPDIYLSTQASQCQSNGYSNGTSAGAADRVLLGNICSKHLAAGRTPAVCTVERPKICPLTKVCFAQDDSAGSPQLGDYAGIARDFSA